MFVWVSSNIPLSLKNMTCAAMNHNIVCGLENGKIMAVNPDHEIQELIGHKSKITSIQCYNEYLATGDSSGLIIIWKYYQNAFYEEMTNDKIHSPISKLSYFDNLLCISYLNGSVILGSGTGQYIWNFKLDAKLVDNAWFNNKLHFLSDLPCQLHIYNRNGESEKIIALSSIQQPLNIIFNPVVANQGEMQFLIKTKKSFYGFVEYDSTNIMQFHDMEECVFLDNYLCFTKGKDVLIYNPIGQFVHKIKTNDPICLVMQFNNQLTTLSTTGIISYKHRSTYKICYLNKTLLYIKSISNQNHLMIYRDNFFRALKVPHVQHIAMNNKELCFIEYNNNCSIFNFSNYYGIVKQSFSLPLNIISVTFNSHFFGFITSHHYFIYKKNTITYLLLHSKTTTTPLEQFQPPPLVYNKKYIKCTSFNRLFYVLTDAMEVMVLTEDLVLLNTITLELANSMFISHFIINNQQLSIINHFQLYVFDLPKSNNNYNVHTSLKPLFIRPNVLDVLFHNDVHVACLEKQKLTILNHESILIDGDVLCEFKDYKISYCNFQSLPAETPTDKQILYSYTLEQRLNCKSINQVPNDHLILYKCLAIDLLKQGNIELAFACCKKSKNIKLLQFTRSLLGKPIDKSVMGSIYEYLGDLTHATTYYLETKEMAKIAKMYLNHSKYKESWEYKEELNKQDMEYCQSQLAAEYFKNGQYQNALLLYREFDTAKAIECAYYSRDEVILKELNAWDIICKKWDLPTIKIDDLQAKIVATLNLEDINATEVKQLYYLQSNLTGNYELLRMQHYLCCAINYLKSYEYDLGLMVTVPLLINKYELRYSLLIRAICAYNLKEYNTSAMCFGRLNVKIPSFYKMNINGQDKIKCEHCMQMVEMQERCRKCEVIFEFDEYGKMIKKLNGYQNCHVCGVWRQHTICKVCHSQ